MREVTIALTFLGNEWENSPEQEAEFFKKQMWMYRANEIEVTVKDGDEDVRSVCMDAK